MDHIPSVKSVMTAFPYYIDASSDLAHARRLMTDHDIRHLPVTRDGKIVGVLSDRDVARIVEATSRTNIPIGELRLAPPYSVGLSEPLDRVLAAMADSHIEVALVLKGERLAGIFTTSDACRSYADFLHQIFPPRDGNDAA